MSDEKKYISLFSGKEIDTILADVANKLDKDDDLIKALTEVADWNTDLRDSLNVVAAHVLWQVLDDIYNVQFDPNEIRDRVEAADDSNTLTDALKLRITQLSDKWLEPVADIAARDAISTTGFEGGEVLVVKNVDGDPATYIWDGFNWVDDNSKNSTKTTGIALGDNIIATFDSTVYSMAKYIVVLNDGAGNIETSEVMVVTDGTNINISETGPTAFTDMYDLSATMNAGTVELHANVLVTGDLEIKKIALM